MRSKLIVAITLFGSILLAVQVCAEEGKTCEQLSSGNMRESDHILASSEPGGTFTVKKKIDGYFVSFHIMPVREKVPDRPSLSLVVKSEESWMHMLKPSHFFMVKIEKNDLVITDVIINARVVHPVNGSESKIMTRTGDWYRAGYNLGHDGQHSIIILFKTADGAKHSGSVKYQENKERS